MSLPLCHHKCLQHAWGLMCLHAVQYLAGQKPVNLEGGGIRMSDSLEIRKIATLTNEYVFFFSFEEGFSAVTGNNDLFASNKYLTG